MKEYGKHNFLGTRKVLETSPEVKLGKYEWITYEKALDTIIALSKGYMELDLCPMTPGDPNFPNTKQMRFLGIYSKNRAEWMLCDQAAMAMGITTVPYYDTLGDDIFNYITAHTQLRTIALTASFIPKILSYKSTPEGEEQLCSLKNLILLDDISEELYVKVEEADLKIYKFSEVIEKGNKSEIELNPAKPETVATISYTSGTTGMPKGVILTHGNMVGCLAGVLSMDWFDLTLGDSAISYLPLAHMWERLLVQMCIGRGVATGFYNGNVFKLKEDLAQLKPTQMASVPRLYNRFYDVIKSKIDETSGLKRKLIDRALSVKINQYHKTGKTTHFFYDKLVFNKMKNVLGGKMRTMTSGSAPLSAEVLDMLKVCFCTPICEGYAQTETCAGGCVSNSDDKISGHCGTPWFCSELKLIDCPEMEYFATDKDVEGNPMPRGEVCYRGTNVTQGYFKDPLRTKDAIDSEGWLHTGDVGQFFKGGRLKIIDRISNCFKLQQGEYIAAEKLENVYIKCPYLAQIFVYGDGMRNYLVALGTLDRDNVFKWAKKTGNREVIYIAIEFEFEEKEDKNKQLLELTQSTELKKVVLESFLYLHNENKVIN